MILLYIIKKGGSSWDDNELRYSLRSVAKHGQNVDSIIIAGHKPAWVQGVTHAPLTDPHSNRANNTWYKMKQMCHNLNRPFVLMNDDFYLQQTTDFETLPHYTEGEIKDLAKKYRRVSDYVGMLYRTEYVLQRNGYPRKNFAVHYPMMIDPVGFRPHFEHFVEEPGLSFRLIYGNMMVRETVELPDLKLSREMSTAQIKEALKDKPMFSIGDRFLNDDGKNYLQELYPEKCKYER